jgi:signal transduction histidine kinase
MLAIQTSAPVSDMLLPAHVPDNYETETRDHSDKVKIDVTQILIVDDEPEITEELAELLLDAGFSVDTSTDPINAIAMITNNARISVVITDLSMPNMTGLEMIDEINRILPAERDVAIIVVTGQADIDRAVKALQLGALDFLSKPIDPNVLIHATERAAETVRLKRLERDFRKQLEHQVLERTEEVQKLSSDLLAANEILKIKNADLEASNQIKSEFLSLISHELRTPLNHIIGFSDLMKMTFDNTDSTDEVKYSQKISEAGNHLLKIINTIFDLININGGDHPLDKTDVNLPKLIGTVCDVLTPKADKTGVDILLVLQSAPTTLYADEHRMTQVIGNILDNAIRFSSKSGTVTVTASSTDDAVSISIADQGIGMTERETQIAEEPFRQVDSSLSKTAYGMGLGLTLSKLIVERHGGQFSVESAPDEGTLVTISIPQKRNAA